MPLIFIHGVNTRDTDPAYHRDVAARSELFRRLLLKPLGAESGRFNDLDILNVYWGDHGVRFAWGQQSLPEVRPLEHLGAEAEATPKSDVELADTIEALASSERDGASLEALGGEDERFVEAARADLPRFMEAMLAPLILSERDLALDAEEEGDVVGKREALLLIAGDEVANDPAVHEAIAQADSEQEISSLLRKEVLQRYERLLVEGGMLSPEEVEAMEGRLEGLGPSWLSDLKERVEEFFDRARDAPKRAATVPVFAKTREDMHINLTRFLGDVFVYLDQRSGDDEPGPIISQVLGDIRDVRERHPDEGIIIVTHSMGGNIFYDILTHYASDLEVDVWISVGGQVGQFEEMKLFRKSDPALGAPQKVKGLQPRVGYWLNVYDPADPFSFLAEPVFEEAEDVRFLTGSSVFKSHGDYFKRPSFYHLLLERITGALS